MSPFLTTPHPLDARTICMDVFPEITPFFSGHGHLEPILDDKGHQVKQRWGVFWKIPLFEFTNSKPPLTFHDFDGTNYQPDNHFPTNGGSIPPFMWGMPFIQLNPMAFTRAYPMHDCLFTYGGLYVRARFEKHYHFKAIPRVFGDSLLRRMTVADGAGVVDAAAIRFGVFVGSRFAWDEEAQRKNRERDNIRLENA